jgi:hypothetical protein
LIPDHGEPMVGVEEGAAGAAAFSVLGICVSLLV